MTAKIPPTKLPKIKDPEAAEEAPPPPKSKWDKVLLYTPVVMTVLATLLAGLSNSELNAAQYERAWAAQLQSKVADQWNFFQVKRIRGSALDNTLELLQTLAHAAPLDPPTLRATIKDLREHGPERAEPPTAGDAQRAQPFFAAWSKLNEAVNAEGAEAALQTAAAGTGPTFAARPVTDDRIIAAVASIEARQPGEDIAAKVRAVPAEALEAAIRTAEDNVTAFDVVIAPTNRSLDAIRGALSQTTTAANALARSQPGEGTERLVRLVSELSADFTAARLRYAARRYDQEASLNRQIAQLTEISVRKSNLIAEHHKERSQLFFFGMIIAQAAVIAATMALAVRQKSVLWGLATAAGLVAVSFGVYVRFFV